MSPSSRRAWIEIGHTRKQTLPQAVALLAEGVDRNFHEPAYRRRGPASPSSRRAWIEIESDRRHHPHRASPSSRRAWIEMTVRRSESCLSAVALLAEGVDRNQKIPQLALVVEGVALLAEGVDRNYQCRRHGRLNLRSPSSRRAWIEICLRLHHQPGQYVALLAEGVDRNCEMPWTMLLMAGRPPRGGRG